MRGDPLKIIIDLITAIGGVWVICVALVGYSLRPVGLVERLFLAIAGVALLLPVKAHPGALSFDLVGFVLGGILIGRQAVLNLRSKRAVSVVQS